MPFINGRWVDEEELMAMRGANPMVYGGTFDTPMIYGGTTDVPDPMLYGGTTDVPSGNIFGQTASSPLQAFTEPSFTQPLAALNRQATGSFQGEGDTMDPAAINAAMGPQLAGPTVNQFRPTGSDYTPQQLSTPIDQLQQQNIPSNVVPIDPTAGLAASDPNLQGVTPFSQASTSSLTPFASSGRTVYDKGPGGWGLDDPTNESTGVPTIIGPSKPGLWPWPPGEDPVTDDKGPGSGWRPGFGTQRDVYAPQPEDDAGDDFFGDGDVSGDYSLSSAGFPEMDRGAMLAAMGPQAYSPPAHIQDRQMQAPQVQAPVPQMQAPQRQAPAPFVAPTYTAPTAPAPIDIDAIRSTVTAPAPFDFSDVSGGRLAEARKYAGQGMFGRAKQQIELGGGDWSTAMHRALRGETGMSPAELEQAKNAAVQQATRAREAQHAANVLAAQKRHAAKAKGAAAKRAAAAKVAAAQQAVIDSQMAAEAAARLKQQQAASAAAAKAAADKVAARRAAATAAATAAAQSSADNTSYQDRMRQMAIDVEAALAAAATAASEDRDSDYNTGSFGPFSKEAIKELFEFVTGEDYGTYDEQQDFIENMRSSGLLSAKQAEQFKGMHLSEWSPFLNTVSAPVQIWDQISDTDWTGYKQFWDAVKTGGKSTFNQLIGGMQQQAGVPYPDIFGDHYGYSDSGMGEQEGSGHPGMR